MNKIRLGPQPGDTARGLGKNSHPGPGSPSASDRLDGPENMGFASPKSSARGYQGALRHPKQLRMHPAFGQFPRFRNHCRVLRCRAKRMQLRPLRDTEKVPHPHRKCLSPVFRHAFLGASFDQGFDEIPVPLPWADGRAARRAHAAGQECGCSAMPRSVCTALPPRLLEPPVNPPALAMGIPAAHSSGRPVPPRWDASPGVPLKATQTPRHRPHKATRAGTEWGELSDTPGGLPRLSIPRARPHAVSTARQQTSLAPTEGHC
jgi:hypothetical protein